MKDDVKRFIESISYDGEQEGLEDLEIEKVLFNRTKETFEVIMTKENVLPYNVAFKLLLASKNGIHHKNNCIV